MALVDIGLPEISGLEILKAATRQGGTQIPVLIITAHDGMTDVITGLDLSADDYILKPFELPILLARIRRANDRSLSLMTSEEITLAPSTQVATSRGIRPSERQGVFAFACLDGASWPDLVAQTDRKPHLWLGSGGAEHHRRCP